MSKRDIWLISSHVLYISIDRLRDLQVCRIVPLKGFRLPVGGLVQRCALPLPVFVDFEFDLPVDLEVSRFLRLRECLLLKFVHRAVDHTLN